MFGDVGRDSNEMSRKYLLERLSRKGVQILTNAKAEEINAEGIVWVDKKNHKHLLKTDTIILGVGAVANNQLAKDLNQRGIKSWLVGDCVGPRKIRDAVHEAFHCAIHL